MEYYEAVNEVPIGNSLRLVKVKEQSPERCQEPGAVCLIEKNVRVSASCAQTALERRKTTAAATASAEATQGAGDGSGGGGSLFTAHHFC